MPERSSRATPSKTIVRPSAPRPEYADRMIERRRFEELVAEAVDSLPRWVLKRLENVEVLVEEWPPRDEPNLLGRYHGIPLTKRSNYAGVLPDTITLYRSTVERSARDEAELRRVIAHTVEHEVAHFFGISDERLRDIGAY
jgi:predicted Zn-dependent protease with MMP-like domain